MQEWNGSYIFCSKCVLIQSVAFTDGTRKLLEVGRAAPLLVSIRSTVVKVQGPMDDIS